MLKRSEYCCGALLAVVVICSSFSAAYAADVQMLPPTKMGGMVRCDDQTNFVLSYSGQTSGQAGINCTPIKTDKDGNLELLTGSITLDTGNVVLKKGNVNFIDTRGQTHPLTMDGADTATAIAAMPACKTGEAMTKIADNTYGCLATGVGNIEECVGPLKALHYTQSRGIYCDDVGDGGGGGGGEESLCLRATSIYEEEYTGDFLAKDNFYSTKINDFSKVTVAEQHSYDWNDHHTWYPSPGVTFSEDHGWRGGNDSRDGYSFGSLINGAKGAKPVGWSKDIQIISGYRVDSGVYNGWQNRHMKFTATVVPCAVPDNVPEKGCTAANITWHGSAMYSEPKQCGTSVPATAGGKEVSVADAFNNKVTARCVDGTWGLVSRESCLFCPEQDVQSCDGKQHHVPQAAAGAVIDLGGGEKATCTFFPAGCGTGEGDGCWDDYDAWIHSPTCGGGGGEG